MENERSIDRLARYLIYAGAVTIVAALCWYFRSVLIYIIGAFVVSLIGQPVMRGLRKIRLKGRAAPDWLLSILTIVLIFAVAILIVTQVIPVVTGILRDASAMKLYRLPEGNLIDSVNQWIAGLFPSLGGGFDAVGLIIDKVKDVFNLSQVSGLIGSVAGVVVDVTVGLFSIVFISFFFIKDEKLFSKVVGALVPDRIEGRVSKTLGEIEYLLSRYFVGLIIEIFGVVLIDFLGLWVVAQIGFRYAIGIAFIAGLLNIIPYVGPLIGEVLGVVFCLILKYGAGVGLDVNIWAFALIVLAVMLTAQLVDNFVYQPLIYSSSIKASALEIFIVLLVAARLGGTFGMLVAIPAYTVVRVVASRFFRSSKVVQRLIPEDSLPEKV